MNSYGDPSSPNGRARIPGRHGDPGQADDAYGFPGGEGRGRAAAPEGTASAGRASVPPRGAGSGGRAAVGGPASVPPRGASGSAAVGRSGRASVPVSPAPGGSAGRASVGTAAVGAASVGAASAGRARVGSVPVGGRASVARAGVTPVSGRPGGPGGPGGPTGRVGPGRRGPGDPNAVARAKKRKRANMLIAAFAVFIMLTGLGVVSFTYYSTNVVLPEDTTPPQATELYAFDNKTLIAKLGTENRTLVTIDQIPQHVQDAVAAAEDRNFYRHSGVDYKGIVRAAWNNLTGGDKQGASTITQQYARNAYDNLNDDTYARKVKEAILASKLTERYDKPTIMQHYLNVIYFGRGAYGIEAAAKTYFGRSAKDLTVAEGAVLAALIKQPVASATHKGYDPAVNPEEAKQRWNYVVQGMVQEGWLNAAGRETAPTAADYPKDCPKGKSAGCLRAPNSAGAGLDYGINTPYGNVINYVKTELRDKGVCVDREEEVTASKPTCSDALMSGGYRIQTTIDTKIQAAAVATAQRKSADSKLAGQPKNLMAAMVAIEPKTGRVRAYYGGDNGTGTDYAGKNTDSQGNLIGGHAPGSTFKIYSLAAALEKQKALESRWKGRAFTPKGTEFKVSNAGTDNPSCGNSCTLRESTLKSLNVPFYHVSEDIGPDKIVDVAKRAGITTMWNTNPAEPHDLTATDADKLAPETFFHVVAYGQYPVTVLDHANGVATFANEGRYVKAHFLYQVQKRNQQTGKWEKVVDEGNVKGKQVIDKEVVADVTSVLKEYPGRVNHRLENGRQAAAKTGTWELEPGSTENGDAWMIGYTPQLATAVWVGNVKDREALRTKDNRRISGSGLPGDIWETFMEKALKGKEKLTFPPAANIGDPDSGNGEAPPPPEPPQQPNCGPFDLFCPPGGGNNGNNGGGSPNDPRPQNGVDRDTALPPLTLRRD
ncbi:transglycosylase domain-containing protein [Micromonospora sp. WMMA1363]|uniref:transglycosylase domain-containing protein n=1 Tax=Micromonospora sp. WMMA1363 TaxID=3053985 RepID=UPI00259D1223|nr:transglycosylase domain-containing protein [Micromonospora sp. WMMA1363]MDM4721725.1 transglycosylase domain-containing protein [Micromonospora sp. WMMA1363]